MVRFNSTLWLLTQSEFNRLPDGTVLTSISGKTVIKGVNHIDLDVRAGYLAFGVVNPTTHPEAELFTVFMLENN